MRSAECGEENYEGVSAGDAAFLSVFILPVLQSGSTVSATSRVWLPCFRRSCRVSRANLRAVSPRSRTLESIATPCSVKAYGDNDGHRDRALRFQNETSNQRPRRR